jgi:hypothetical protein
MPAGSYFGFNYLLLLIKEVFGCNGTWKIEDRKQRESFYYYYYQGNPALHLTTFTKIIRKSGTTSYYFHKDYE